MCPVVVAAVLATHLTLPLFLLSINGAFAFYVYFHLSVRSFVEFFLLLSLLFSVEISCLTLFHFSTASDTCLPPHTHTHLHTLPFFPPPLLVCMHKYLRFLLSYQIIYGAKGAGLLGGGEWQGGGGPGLGPGQVGLALLLLFACCRKISICAPPTPASTSTTTTTPTATV